MNTEGHKFYGRHDSKVKKAEEKSLNLECPFYNESAHTAELILEANSSHVCFFSVLLQGLFSSFLTTWFSFTVLYKVLAVIPIRLFFLITVIGGCSHIATTESNWTISRKTKCECT